MVRSLLRSADLSPEDVATLLDLAAEFARVPMQHHSQLDGEIVVMYMDKPSTRTRLSFDAAVHRLGGDTAVVAPEDLQLGRGETVEDTARVISRYASCFIIRTFSDEIVRRFADAATIPVINALTDLHHPCQSIADLFTLRQRFGTLAGLRVAYVGDARNNVAHSLIEAAALTGIHLSLAAPEGHRPDADVLALGLDIARSTGASIQVNADPREAVHDARAIYTDTWFSMGIADAERASRSATLAAYRVDDALMGLAASDAVFMHCLPAHRGEEVTAEVIDGPQSIVFDQAENRLYTEQAILFALLTRRLTGRVGSPEHAQHSANR